MLTPNGDLGQRVAGDPRPGVGADRRGPEPGADAVPGEDAGAGGRRCAARTRSTRCSTCWPRTRPTPTWRSSGCRSRTSPSRCGSPGCRSTTTRRARRPDGLLGQEHPHPRAYGTFPRILRKYVREERRLTLEDAIRKFTSLPAQRMRLGDRGRAQGRDVGGRGRVRSRPRCATGPRSPSRTSSSEGMQWVLVNGIPVIADGKATGALPGRVLRGPGVPGALIAAAPSPLRRRSRYFVRMPVDVTSEIGQLQTVLVHTPGRELEAVTPGNREDYLYDDIIDLEIAQREHRQFVSVLRRFARVFQVRDLLAEILAAARGPRVPDHQDDGRGRLGRAGPAARHAAAGADRRDADRGHPRGERARSPGRSTRRASPSRRCPTSSSPATSAW